MYIHDLVHSMDGFDFEVLTSSRRPSRVVEFDGNVKVVRVPEYARPTSTPVTPAWARALRRTDADLIHFHMPNPFGELMLLASRTSVPVVASYHADIVGREAILPLYLPFQQRVLRRAEQIIVGSPPMREAPRLSAHRDKLVLIPYGIDPESWSTRPALADELRQRFGPKIVMFLGRLAFYKGIHVLISAMRDVDAHLLIAGSGPKESELRDLVRTLGLRSRATFVGEVADEERAAYYFAADVFAFPGTMRAEAFGFAMVEAMATGTPVVSTELGTGTSWVNVHGETGLVIPPDDAKALSAALRELLRDPAAAQAMGAAGARRVAECFTKKAMLSATANLYRSVVT
jgi:rhamnosyl/mannosyltransferase